MSLNTADDTSGRSSDEAGGAGQTPAATAVTVERPSNGRIGMTVSVPPTCTLDRRKVQMTRWAFGEGSDATQSDRGSDDAHMKGPPAVRGALSVKRA